MIDTQLVIVERSLSASKPHNHDGRSKRREFLADITYWMKNKQPVIDSCHVHLAGKAERYPDKAIDQIVRAFFLGTIKGKVLHEGKSYEFVGKNDVYR